jgi:hypothetical protein
VKVRTGAIAGVVVLAALAATTSADASLPGTGQLTLPSQTGAPSIGELGQALEGPGQTRFTKPKRRRARWLKKRVRRRAHRAARKGKGTQVEDVIFKSCPGVGPTVPGVQAGTCEVAPAGCTANFIFYNGPTVNVGGVLRPRGASGPPFTSDGDHWFIGTAGHCLPGSRVYMQVRPPGVWVPDSDVGGIAEIGKTAKKMNGGVGRDFGAVRIYKRFLVTPSLPIGGPQGIYDRCDPSPVHYYGHGYAFAVAQGKPEGGAAFWPNDGYYWAGPLLPGDSGSGVLMGPMAAGDLTHGLGVTDADVPLPVGFGTRMTKILDFLGRGFYLVNADGTLSRSTTRCSGVDPLGPALPN